MSLSFFLLRSPSLLLLSKKPSHQRANPAVVARVRSADTHKSGKTLNPSFIIHDLRILQCTNWTYTQFLVEGLIWLAIVLQKWRIPQLTLENHKHRNDQRSVAGWESAPFVCFLIIIDCHFHTQVRTIWFSFQCTPTTTETLRIARRCLNGYLPSSNTKPKSYVT